MNCKHNSTRKTTPKHIIIKLLKQTNKKNGDKEKSLEEPKENT